MQILQWKEQRKAASSLGQNGQVQPLQFLSALESRAEGHLDWPNGEKEEWGIRSEKQISEIDSKETMILAEKFCF